MSIKKDKPTRSYSESLYNINIGDKKRKTGIEIIGEIPWGTHLCQFYKTKDDLIDILVPFFKTGLDNNEFCMWITSEPLHIDDAKRALQKTMKNLDDYIKKGQIEILDATEWYTKSGKFNADEVLSGWIKKEAKARGNGFDGLRLSGNTFWLEKKDWKDFTNYEGVINNVIGNYNMIAICSYSLDKCNASEIIDVVSNHEFALIKREGIWHRIENPKLKTTEKKLKEKAKEQQIILDSVPALIFYKDKENRFIRTNKAFENAISLSKEMLEGKSCFNIFPKKQAEKYWNDDKQVMKTRKAKYGIVEIMDTPKGTRIVQTDKIPYFDESGNIGGVIGFSIDITKRKKTEDKLAHLYQQNELILGSTAEGILGLDIKGNHTFINPAAARMLGYGSSELLGRPSHSVWHHTKPDGSPYPADECEIYASYRDGVIHHVYSELFWRKDGTSFPVEYASTPIYEQGRLIGAVVTFADITERIKIESILQKKTEELEQFFNLALDLLCIADTDGNFIKLNKAWENILGYSVEFLEKKKFLDFVHPDDLEGTMKAISELASQKSILNFTNRYRCKDGTYRYIEWRSYPKGKLIYAAARDITERIQTEMELTQLASFPENNPNPIVEIDFLGVIHYSNPSTKKLFPGLEKTGFRHPYLKGIKQLFSELQNNKKHPSMKREINIGNKFYLQTIHYFSENKRIRIYNTDITDRKKIEKNIIELNQNLMQQTNELAASNKELETFSYSVSHDLRGPLRSIDGFSQALLEDYEEKLDEQGKEYIQRVLNATQRIGQLIDDMLRLSRLTRTEMTIQRVDLGQTAETIIEELKKSEPNRKIKFIKHNKLIAQGDTNLMHILLENLLDNAWKFTKKCKQVEIEFGKKQQGKETVFFIRDNGAGFDMKYADKLFLPFQRLHNDADYPGTGIGLGIVSRIIHRHGGRIWADAEENKGATFYFTLGGKTNE